MFMEIEKINLSNLRNDEHYQFHTEVNKLITEFNPVTLDIVDAYTTYLTTFNNESDALYLIRKSAITDEMSSEDVLRDNLYRGVCDTVRGATNHYQAEVGQTAERIMKVLNHYGDITLKTYDDESADIFSLIIELTTNHSSDVTALNLTGWLDALETHNISFITLQNSRYSEEAAKTVSIMKQARKETDSVYDEITKRINALIVINGETTYQGFVCELNELIARYKHSQAQQRLHKNVTNSPAK
jgi:hypothetical protein